MRQHPKTVKNYGFNHLIIVTGTEDIWPETKLVNVHRLWRFWYEAIGNFMKVHPAVAANIAVDAHIMPVDIDVIVGPLVVSRPTGNDGEDTNKHR